MESPLVLAIETSGKTGGIALFKETLLAEISLLSKESYSTIIFKSFPFLEKNLKFSLEDVDYYAIDVGPGSFTGLRIGLSILKGFNLVFPKPVIPVSSLEVLATNFVNYPGNIVSLVDAYSKEIFLASYKWENFYLKSIISPLCIPLKDLPLYVNTPSLFLSETLEKWKDFLKENLKSLFLEPPFSPHLSASLVAKLAYIKLKYGVAELKDAETLLPLYLKPSEAERKSGLKITW
ncbi:MAG: tRNA (adenosine(37)-N6)-threonylcarbamoyltransferase complex dimerization subunit type 1 TsaB [Thermodesulfobacterium geofontis]|uniref:tRNA (Adenosine(37)-N6)-threonylcarbamoyltransferase complex dimerization subunit type 1 TsaB n=1 Tax=Thermodesulfobacterium geofontis TaxID=1295609 RepID=A0A2N7PQN3_9BACT|nr:MAG: tRNA (adenosine(37)-N6)-threonylcarbamoyltransferase complex dimerization subunit type 1 TsaB [Thermodesulfobacterium geofontis]